ncbi:MAG: histidine--tRNA ligase [Candidatus Electryonea clarkiae]|nr:histidine--tRNA ligase [Candidatus Electryonea clarkiae]MDP8288101.1 histidine--tRNA ligase [Candidatus Electryonea clarkiae]
MGMIKPRNFKGTRDFNPSEMIQRESMIEKMKRVFKLYGFSPLETPALEMLEILSGKYGYEGDRLIYRLDYKNERPKDRVALRYDLTVPLSRFVAMHPELPMPFKRYQIQPVWRADRPQPHQGRFREFYQCDVDTIGAEEGIADAEIIALTVQMMSELGFSGGDKQPVTLINHRKILEGLLKLTHLPIDQLPDFCRILDKLDKIGWEEVQNELMELGINADELSRLNDIFEMKGTSDSRIDALKQLLPDNDVQDGIKRLSEIFEHFKNLNVAEDSIRFEPRLARGLDYYTGVVFETVLPDHPHIGSLTGGGRYDKLIGLYSGRDLPATGTTIGLDRIFAAMEQLNMIDTVKSTVSDVLIASFSNDEMASSLKVSEEFRRNGINTELFPNTGKLKKPLNYANKKKIPFVAILGPDEIADPENIKVSLRNLNTSTQVTISIEDAIQIMKKL